MVEVNGKNGIVVRVLAHSISPQGKPMWSFEFEYNRWILAEVNTHRMVSKNSASSRAVPFEKMIEMIMTAPAMPVHWGKNQAGMTAKEELSEIEQISAKSIWVKARDLVIEQSKQLFTMGLHKQVINRLTEPWSMMKTVASGTNWDNLLYLRDDEDAQPEFRELARCLRVAMQQSTPTPLFDGEWHLPYINTVRDAHGVLHYLDSDGGELTLDEAKQISASCCAQVSYRRLNDTKVKALEIFGRLFSGRVPHMSPVEHQATPIVSTSKNVPWDFSTWENGVTHVTRLGQLCSGNLHGWIQYRQTLPNNVYGD